MNKKGKILDGVGASPGIVQGEAFVLPQLDKKPKPDQILIVTEADPAMIEDLQKAKAIITEEGGMTSHPAVIARENQIPCIVEAQNATKVIKNSDQLEINGSTGEIYLLS